MPKTTSAPVLGAARVRGTLHEKLDINNQDDFCVFDAVIPGRKRPLRIGLVADGCTNIPTYTRNEVGAALTVTFCFGRLQRMALEGMPLLKIAEALPHELRQFLTGLANTAMPATTYWPFPFEFDGVHADRNQMDATHRFKVDYLAATVAGFIDDGQTLVNFQAGDGVTIMNGHVAAVDQNNEPDYPVFTADGFLIAAHKSTNVRRLTVATDGIKRLLGLPSERLYAAISDTAQETLGRKKKSLTLEDILFAEAAANPFNGMAGYLKRCIAMYPEAMEDDCTVVTYFRGE